MDCDLEAIKTKIQIDQIRERKDITDHQKLNLTWELQKESSENMMVAHRRQHEAYRSLKHINPASSEGIRGLHEGAVISISKPGCEESF